MACKYPGKCTTWRRLKVEDCRCGHPKHAAQCPNPTGCWCDEVSVNEPGGKCQ